MTPVDTRLTHAPTHDLRIASAHGLATYAADGAVLDVWFPDPVAGHRWRTRRRSPATWPPPHGDDAARGTTQAVIALEINLDVAPADAAGCLAAPAPALPPPGDPQQRQPRRRLRPAAKRRVDQLRPCAVADFERTRLRLRPRGALTVYGVDKFPRMLDYVVPSGVRVADGGRVRLGAHLAPGTTVMHEGFVNFNAGTLGASMVEGRISASRRGRRRVGRGRRRLHHGHPLRRRQGEDRHRRARAAGRKLRAWASPSATTPWWRPGCTSPPAPGSSSADTVGQGRGTLRCLRTCSSAATRSPAPSRRCRAPASTSN